MRLPSALKRLTTPVVGSIPLPILAGENKGCRWSLASWGSGYGTGRREEAQMRMLAFLIRSGLKWNRVSNVTVEPYAVGSVDGPARFGGGETSKQHRIGVGEETVEVRTIGTLLGSGERRQPSFLKIDVEGAEGQLLEAGRGYLPPAGRMVIAAHSQEAYERCVEELGAAGFRIYETSRLERRKAGRWRGDADMIAFGPAYEGYQRDMESIRSLSV
jgi:FkbM family methyltransferase